MSLSFAQDKGDPRIHYSVARLIDEVLDLCRERFRSNNVQLTCDAIAPNVLLLCQPVELGQMLWVETMPIKRIYL